MRIFCPAGVNRFLRLGAGYKYSPDAEKPGQKWVSDITNLHTTGGWIYLDVVLYLFNRKVIGWVLSGNMKTPNTTVYFICSFTFCTRKLVSQALFQ